MYKIYIKNFISENDPSLLDYSEVLFDSSDIQYDEFDRTVSEPVVKEGLNKSGSFEFTVSPQNPYYDRIKIIKTLFTVYLDDEMIFRGRVMSMTDDLYRQRSVFCEGELAYLNDSLQPPVKEDVLGPSDFFKKMITDHNDQMNLFKSKLKPGDDPKTFEKGVSDVGDNGLSYVRVSGTGEIVLTDENGNYVISGSEAIRAQFSWEIGSINGTTGANEDSVYYIRSVDPVEVKFGSIVKVVSGYKAAVITYYTESNTDKVMTSGLFTDQYWVQKDGRIRIIITRDLESGAEQQAFTATDVSTVPDEALILTGLSMTAISHHEHSVTMTPFNSTSYRNTLDAIESDLINVYGGYLSVRYANGKRYIDYTKDPPHNNESQRIISFGVNLQELSKEINGEEIYSILLPTGDSNLLLKESKKNQLLTNTQSIYLPLDSAISEFGPIFKTQAFSGVTKRDDLQDYASNYVDKTYHGAAASYTIKAVDMHFVDPSHRLIRAGSKCRITLWPAQIIQNRTCTEATFELQSPENNEYVFESISNERDSLTSKYKKQTSASRRSNYGVSTTPTTAESGAGSEDTVIRSNGNIILYPGTDKMVSIPLAKTFLAPNLTNWSLGAVKYTSSGGLKVDNKAEIGQNLLVKGKAIIGSSTDMFSSMPVSTTLFVNGGIHGKLIRGSTIMVGSTGLGSDGQFRIMKSDTTPGANIYQPVQLKLLGGKDENGADVVLADMWVLGNKDVNFNIADTTWFKERAGTKDVDLLEDHCYPDLAGFLTNDLKSKLKHTFALREEEVYSTYKVISNAGEEYYFAVNATAVKNGVNVSDAKILSDHSYDNLSDFVSDSTERSKTLVLGSYPKKEIYSNFEITLDNGNKYYFGLNASALVNSVKNDVGITGPFWTDGNNKPDGYTYPTWAYVNYKTDSSSPKTTDDLKLYIVGEGFTDHKKNVYLVEGSGSVSSGTIRAQLIVDASTEYRSGYTTGQDNVSASIGDISYTSKSASYENGSLLLAASASGTLTKKSISGSDVTSPISSGSKLLDIPVTVGTVAVNAPQWKNGKYTITADGSLKVDDETINLYQGSIAGGFVPTEALNSVNVKKGTWVGKSITFTTDAPKPNANAQQTLTLSWNNDTTWSWDDDNGYQQKYQIKDVDTVIDTVYATIPDMAVGLTEPGKQKSTWWKTSGADANKYVIPGTSAAAYLATDTAKAHPLSNLKTGSDIVITPTEAINAGFKIAHDSITLSQTGSSVVKPGKSVTIYPKALSDATDTSPDNITAISAILTAPAATKTDKVILESTDINNNVSKTGIIVHYSDNSTTNGLQVLIDASAVYSAGIAKGESQGSSAGYTEGYTTGQDNVSAEITKIAYHSKTASYSNGTLEIGADATGSMTKTPQEGDPTVTALSKYDILTVPVTTTPAVLKIGSWSSSTNKISITKNSGGTANVDGEAIAVGVSGAEITVTPGANTIGTPVHQGNGIYNLSATGTVDINGTTAYLSGSDSFTATGAINYGKNRVGLYKTYNWTGSAGVTINGQSGQYKYHYYIRTSGRTDVNGNTSEDGDYLNPSSAINYGKTLVTPSLAQNGWEWTQSGSKWKIDNPIVVYNPDNASNAYSENVSLPTITPHYESGKIKALAKDKESVTKSVSEVAFAITVDEETGTPSSSPQTLGSGKTYAVNIKEGDGSKTAIAYYSTPAQAAAGGKVSKTEWSNGNSTFTAGTSGQDEIVVALTVSPSTNWGDANVPLNPTFRIFDGSENTGLSGTFYLDVRNDSVYVKSNTSGPSVGTNVLAKQTNTAYAAGKQAVTVKSVTRAENCTYDIDAEEAYDDVIIELWDGENVTKTVTKKDVDFSDAYKDGLYGRTYSQGQNYEIELADSEGNYIDTVDWSINTSGIYLHGASSTVNELKIYSEDGSLVTAYNTSNFMSGIYGALYPNTPVTQISTSGNMVQISCEGQTAWVRNTYLKYGKGKYPFPSNYGKQLGWQSGYTYSSYVMAASGSTVRIRKTASSGGAIVTTVPIGATIYCKYNPESYPQTSGQDVNWMPVKYGSYTGYMMTQYIAGTDEFYRIGVGSGMDENYTWVTRVMSATSDSVPMYSSQSTGSARLMNIPNDRLVYCDEDYRQGDEWVELKYADTVGYVQAKYVRGTVAFEEEQQRVEENIDTYVTGVYTTDSSLSACVNLANIWVYYTHNNVGHDEFVLKGSKSDCYATDTRYNSNKYMIREINSDDERLSGKTLHIVFNDGSTVDKTCIFTV